MRWSTKLVRALGPRRAPLPTRVVALWIAAPVLLLGTALALTPTSCSGSTSVPCRWPWTQSGVPTLVALATVVAAALATRSAYRHHRGRAEGVDWTRLGWVVPVAAVVLAYGVVSIGG